jgi:hypothetical protein
MDKRKKAPQREEKAKSTKTNIHVSCEYHHEKTGYARIRHERKCPTTQDPQDSLRIFQHQIMLNERAIQARRESLRESKVTLREHQTSLAGNRTVTLKANKSRETRPRRPCPPAISPDDASNCVVFQVKSANSYRGTRIFEHSNSDARTCIREGYCGIALQYLSLHSCTDENIQLSTMPCPSGPRAWPGRTGAMRKAYCPRPRS